MSHGWHWVDQAVVRPHRCSIFPQIGNGMGHMFIDTQQDSGSALEDPMGMGRPELEATYISDVAADEIARFRGWIHPQVLQKAQEKIEALKAEIAELEAANAKLQEFRDSVDILAPHGLGAKKLPGRKPKKEESSAVG